MSRLTHSPKQMSASSAVSRTASAEVEPGGRREAYVLADDRGGIDACRNTGAGADRQAREDTHRALGRRLDQPDEQDRLLRRAEPQILREGRPHRRLDRI